VGNIISHCGKVKISVVVFVWLEKTRDIWRLEQNFAGQWDDFFKNP
jgi:hypothetical protein